MREEQLQELIATRVHRPGAIAIENQLASADRSRDEVAIPRDLRGVAEIEPAASKYPLALVIVTLPASRGESPTEVPPSKVRLSIISRATSG